jgi:hypothetical protein
MKKLLSILLLTGFILAARAPVAIADDDVVFPLYTGIIRCSPNLLVTDAQVCPAFGDCLPLSINPSNKVACSRAVSIAIAAVEFVCHNSITYNILKFISPTSVIGTTNGSQYTFSAFCGLS